jgi:hypothetical protein
MQSNPTQMMSAGTEVMHAARQQWGQQYTGEGVGRVVFLSSNRNLLRSHLACCARAQGSLW